MSVETQNVFRGAPPMLCIKVLFYGKGVCFFCFKAVKKWQKSTANILTKKSQ